MVNKLKTYDLEVVISRNFTKINDQEECYREKIEINPVFSVSKTYLVTMTLEVVEKAKGFIYRKTRIQLS